MGSRIMLSFLYNRQLNITSLSPYGAAVSQAASISGRGQLAKVIRIVKRRWGSAAKLCALDKAQTRFPRLPKKRRR